MIPQAMKRREETDFEMVRFAHIVGGLWRLLGSISQMHNYKL
jgi:hypothetical protein